MRKISLILLLGQILIILIFIRQLPPQIPLFYSRPWGNEQLSPFWGISILPGLSLLVFLLNSLLSLTLKKEPKLLANSLQATSTIFSLFCLITLFQILKLII